jgi:hypothetical protein
VDDQEFKDLSHGAYALQAAGAHKYTLIWLHDVGQSVDTLKTLANIIQPQVNLRDATAEPARRSGFNQ